MSHVITIVVLRKFDGMLFGPPKEGRGELFSLNAVEIGYIYDILGKY